MIEFKSKLSVALIGLGNVSEAHIKAYGVMDDIEITAVVEPRPARLSEVAHRTGAPGFADGNAMLEAVRPDIAVVMTPAGTHRPVVEQLAAAGVHILCEKPMAGSAEDAQAMVTACAQSGVLLHYGSSYRYLPAVVAARALIEAGAVGTVRLVVETVIGGEGLAAFRPMGEVHYPAGEPGGGEMGLVDHGIHLLDIIPWLAGSPVQSVIGAGNRTGIAPQPEFAVLRLQSGALGILMYEECSVSSDLPAEGVFSAGETWDGGSGFSGRTGTWQSGAGSIRVHGSAGALRIFHYANKLYLTDKHGQREIPVSPVGAPAHFADQLRALVTSIRTGGPAAVPGSVGVAAMQVLAALYQAETAGGWQSMS